VHCSALREGVGVKTKCSGSKAEKNRNSGYEKNIGLGLFPHKSYQPQSFVAQFLTVGYQIEMIIN
jgi:hypothetical protein